MSRAPVFLSLLLSVITNSILRGGSSSVINTSDGEQPQTLKVFLLPSRFLTKIPNNIIYLIFAVAISPAIAFHYVWDEESPDSAEQPTGEEPAVQPWQNKR